MGRFTKLELDTRERTSYAALQNFGRTYASNLSEADRFMSRGDYQEAIRHFSRLIATFPQRPEPKVGEIRCLIELNELERAENRVEVYTGQHPDYGPLQAAKAQLCLRRKNYRLGQAISTAALEGETLDAYVWLVRGEALLTEKKLRPAAFCFAQALAGNGHEAQIFAAVGRTYLHYGYEAKAIEIYNRRLRQTQDEAVIWFLLGEAQEYGGQMDQARLCYQQALAIEPGMRAATKAKNNLKSRPFGKVLNYLNRVFR